jgi:2-dehydro-3-deoxygluconokinase
LKARRGGTPQDDKILEYFLLTPMRDQGFSMNKSEAVFEKLITGRCIAFLAPASAEDCIFAYETLDPMGIVLEVALRTAKALEGIRALVDAHPDAAVLAGTVMTPDQADLAIRAGAAGIVSADFIPGVVERCVADDVMCVPGGIGDAGKQLVLKAELCGCDLETLCQEHPHQWIYKLFPAITEHQMFYSLSSHWKSAYKGLRVVYSGGITLDNLAGLVRFDPEGIYCGSAVTRKIHEPGAMREEAGRWLDLIHHP